MPSDKRFEDFEARLVRLETAFKRPPDPIFDPAPEDWGWLPKWFHRVRIPIPRPPNPGDPINLDITRLNRVQLELALADIKAERIRLDALQSSLEAQMKQVG